jgi:hypothetical protein
LLTEIREKTRNPACLCHNPENQPDPRRYWHNGD